MCLKLVMTLFVLPVIRYILSNVQATLAIELCCCYFKSISRSIWNCMRYMRTGLRDAGNATDAQVEELKCSIGRWQ